MFQVFIDEFKVIKMFSVLTLTYDVFYLQCVIDPPKPGPQSRALCGTVCALSIAIASTLLN